MSEVPIAVLARVPKLTFSFFIVFLKFKRKVKKSAKRMRKSMIKHGMSRGDAARLTEIYEESVSIRKLIQSTGADLPFSFFT
jgi:hypothetical protein